MVFCGICIERETVCCSRRQVDTSCTVGEGDHSLGSSFTCRRNQLNSNQQLKKLEQALGYKPREVPTSFLQYCFVLNL